MKPYLQHLVVLLDDTSVAYCHAQNPLLESKLMPIDVLHKAIMFGMKQNLKIQFVYPNYELPDEYNALIETIDHIKIGKDVQVLEFVPETSIAGILVLRLSIEDFIAKQNKIAGLLEQTDRVNICLTDIENFTDNLIEDYKKALLTLSSELVALYNRGVLPQVNILTDRLQLTEMHNCEAGVGNITIAPNGNFYICPAFYYDEQMDISNRLNCRIEKTNRSVGSLDSGLNIPNKQLLKLDHAPLCRICDAFHCNRCIWLNQKLTWDNNTPSHQQCVIAHIERNVARKLQFELIEMGWDANNEISEISYLDPFDIREKY